MSWMPELRALLRQIEDLNSAAALLSWDQSTYMPAGGAGARARQMALLRSLAHQRLISPALGELLDRARAEVASLPCESPDAALVRLALRQRGRAVRVPPELVERMEAHFAKSFVAWTRARPENDFATMRPLLEETVRLSRRWSECFDGWEHMADPHIDEMDRGMTAASVRALFAGLRPQLVSLVRAISERPAPRDDFLHGDFPQDAQLALGEELLRQLGYDFERGRQDLTHHPFMTRFSIGDVRITTRVRRDDVSDALFSTAHECGHALYEQSVDPSLDGSPLGHGVSAGIHESQSRLWENMVVRSRGFWQHFLPAAAARFPEQLGEVSVDDIYRAVNLVRPSLIRVDADEVTYNLHVMVRFELALAMLEGKLAVKDLPEAWNERYERDLGLRPPDDRRGVLQDVHWYCEAVGGLFQGYTIGNVASAQLFRAAIMAHPEIEDGIREGDFSTLLGWLRRHVYRHGSIFTPAELVERATGRPLGTSDYLGYLRQKFGELYALDPERVAAKSSPA